MKDPHHKRREAVQALLLLLGYPLAAVAVMRVLTPHVSSPWLLGSLFILFTMLFLRQVTGVRTRKLFGRRW